MAFSASLAAAAASASSTRCGAVGRRRPAAARGAVQRTAPPAPAGAPARSPARRRDPVVEAAPRAPGGSGGCVAERGRRVRERLGGRCCPAARACADGLDDAQRLDVDRRPMAASRACEVATAPNTPPCIVTIFSAAS